MTFELFYRSGGHGGPYDGMTAAVVGAMRFLGGCYGDDAVDITPRGGSDRRDLRIIKARHFCGCRHCPAYQSDAVFFHVETIETSKR